ncbi:MAG TPA: glycosyl hydrolase family 17 protein [Phycisphaerae bacterium]|nr:glycosyl hydrolase family 17 protein [Phycisphaerae bacterium]HNU44933.1 glycosyl hydrolase family 17 protein [Phycisphaerae bacterium]
MGVPQVYRLGAGGVVVGLLCVAGCCPSFIACEDSPAPYSPSIDSDSDGVRDPTDSCPGTPPGDPVDANGCSVSQRGTDDDGVSAADDLCPQTPSGEDVDANGCSASQRDTDADGVVDAGDNCPDAANPGQADADGNGVGDECDKVVLTVVGGSGSGPYARGASIQVAAQVPVGKRFNQWTGDVARLGDVYAATTTLQLSDEATITATFFEWPAVSCKVHGVDFGPFVRPGQNPDQGGTVGFDQVRELIAAMGPYVEWIRTYGCSLGVEEAPAIARSFGLKVAVGVWIGKDASANEREINAAVTIANAGNADLIIVGSEALLRADVTAAQLVDYIEAVKSGVSGVPVGASDAWSALLANPTVMEAGDVVIANFYPYWEGISLDTALSTLNQQYDQLTHATTKSVMVGETGWPSGGNAVGAAVPGPDNAAFYFKNFISWAEDRDVDYFYFEAFDEPWKEANEGPQGKAWGVFTSAGVMKTGMLGVFDCERLDDNWSGAGCRLDDPTLRLTYVPAPGSCGAPDDVMQGQVCHVDTATHILAVYIRVGSGWWTKPYWDRPVTTIGSGGGWECDICTGGTDGQANRVAVFLLPSSFEVPLLRGGTSLPSDLYSNAVGYVEADRAQP